MGSPSLIVIFQWVVWLLFFFIKIQAFIQVNTIKFWGLKVWFQSLTYKISKQLAIKWNFYPVKVVYALQYQPQSLVDFFFFLGYFDK